jgi:tetratricopeptide (TPR) repeat protein
MIKKLFFVILCLTFLTNTSFEQEQFLQAFELFEQGEYRAAFDAYNAIKNKGSATWYNMGICLYKLQKPINAYLYFRRALHGAPKLMCAQTYALCDAIKQKVRKSYHVSKGTYVQRMIHSQCADMPLFFLQWITLLLWYLSSLFLLLFILRKKRYFLLLFFCLFPLWITSLIGYYQQRDQRCDIYNALVMQCNTSVYAIPDDCSHKVAQLDVLDEVVVDKRYDCWHYVKAPTGTAGWVQKSCLAKI